MIRDIVIVAASSLCIALFLALLLTIARDWWINHRAVNRRLSESVHPARVRTTIHTAPSANPAAKPAVMIITDFPLISHDHPYVARLK